MRLSSACRRPALAGPAVSMLICAGLSTNWQWADTQTLFFQNDNAALLQAGSYPEIF
jgi:hypothetical protein